MAEFGAWTLATCGLAVVGIGLVFAILRPALLPEDRRYLDAPAPALDEVLPALARWLKKVFIVMGGYMAATGVLTINLALTEVRAGSMTALVIAAFAGGSSVGLMAVVNIVLRSDFRRPLIALAAMWAASVTLAAFGTCPRRIVADPFGASLAAQQVGKRWDLARLQTEDFL